jgi:hypothetical protein
MLAPVSNQVWHDVSMVKRSTRMAKRDDFLNTVRAMEESIGSPSGKKPVADASDGQDGSEATAEKPDPALEKE